MTDVPKPRSSMRRWLTKTISDAIAALRRPWPWYVVTALIVLIPNLLAVSFILIVSHCNR